MSTRKWSDVRATKGARPRLTKERADQILRHAEVGGNISAAMAEELFHEIATLTAHLVMAERERVVLQVDLDAAMNLVDHGLGLRLSRATQ